MGLEVLREEAARVSFQRQPHAQCPWTCAPSFSQEFPLVPQHFTPCGQKSGCTRSDLHQRQGQFGMLSGDLCAEQGVCSLSGSQFHSVGKEGDRSASRPSSEPPLKPGSNCLPVTFTVPPSPSPLGLTQSYESGLTHYFSDS